MNSISENFEKFIKSIKNSDIEEAKANFDFEYFNMEDKYGLKPIHWACLTCNIEILDWILQEKCDIETSSINGWRPIHFVSFIGNEEMETFLIKNYCKLDCKTDNGEAILDVANGDCNHEFIDEIFNENINLKIGLSMGLKCGADCKHDFCLRSVIHAENYIIKNNQSNIVYSYNDRKFKIRIREICDYGEYEISKCIGPKINEILTNLNHSNIIKYYGLIKIETKMILFTEWTDNISLREKLKQIKSLNNSTIYRYCKDILQAVVFLHDNKILHRFIKPSKYIFVDNNGACKLALSDYSYLLADGDVKLDYKWWRKYKRYSFVAPELVRNGILSYPYDIWMLGCTMIEMSTGKRLDYQFVKCEDIEKIISEISNEMLQSFIRSMVMENPKKRSRANELLNHEYMRNEQ